MGQESSHSPKIRLAGVRWDLPVALGAAVAVYCLALRRYGLELADEGALLAHLDRVAHGQVPYRDFHVGYGPALYWLHVPVLAWWGGSITAVRVGLAFVHAVRVILLACLATTFGGRGWAAAAGLALVAFFLPIAPGVCAPGNIPYPSWYADALALVAVLVLGRGGSTVLVGALWGLAFAFKQNTGLLGLAAAAVTVVLAAGPTADARRGPGLAMAAAMLAGTGLVLRDYLDATLAAVFVLPLLPLAFALARAPVARATVVALSGLAAGFVLVAGPVVGVMLASAGTMPVVTDFLQIGTDTARVYHAALPALADVGKALDGVGLARALRIVADAAWFVVLPIAHLAATVLVGTGRVRSRGAIAVVATAALGYLELYPRMDFWHLLPLAPVSLVTASVVAGALGSRAADVLAGLLVVASLGRLVPALPVLAEAVRWREDPPRVARLDLAWDLHRDEAVRRLPELVGALAGRRTVAGFPALGIVNFALGAPSPWRHDYFFPGRPTADEERALVAATLRDPPEAIVVLDATDGPFAAAFAAHPVLVEMLERAFVEERRVGPYRILVPRRGA
jgi:hypothetical protein